MNIKKVNIVFKFFIICLFALFLVSTVSANDEVVNTNFSDGNSYIVTSDLSNDEIQSMFDNANNGDTFQFTSKDYDNISLIVNKQLNLLSSKNSTINVASSLSDKAKNLGIGNTFGFYFTQNSSGSLLSGFNRKDFDKDFDTLLK